MRLTNHTCLILFIFLFSKSVVSQEICGNAIDDDGDCNVDCDDLECGTSTIVNSNGDPADFVVGQINFTSASSSTTDSTYNQTYDIAKDPVSGKIFVSDINNHRVLRYASIDAFLYTKKAEAVLGQSDFITGTSGLSSTKFNAPTGIYVDNAGILWVTDWSNHRVLRFDDAANKSNGAAADGVLGQTNFTSNSSGTTQSTMSNPIDVFVESDGTLWVSDQNNHRILRFDIASAKANGANADAVLGKSNFTSTGTSPTQSNIGSASGIVVICNTLYATDYTNNRILWWDNPQSKANGANADGIFGQSNYTSSGSGTNQQKFRNPRILTSDFQNNLYVCDAGNHRILVFNEANAKANYANSDLVLGQPNFTSSTPGTTQSRINNPRGIGVIENSNRSYLAVGDRSNHRFIVWGVIDQTTDEVSSLSGVLPGSDPSGSGGLTFAIVAQPAVGTVVIDNTSTGDYTYTPSGACPLNTDSVVTFQYSVSNNNGCSVTGEMAINVTNQYECPEICNNGIDDNGDGRIDEAIPGGVSLELAAWLKADEGVKTGAVDAVDGGVVNTWEDQSPFRTNDASDANFASPTYRNNSTDNLNFNPVIDFDGVNDGLSYGSDFIYSSGNGDEDGMTWLVVVQPDVQSPLKTRQHIIDFGRAPSTGYGCIYGEDYFSMYTPTSHGGVSMADQAHSNSTNPVLVNFSIDFGSTQSVSINGASPAASSAITLAALTGNEINENPIPLATDGPFSIGHQSKTESLASDNGRRYDGKIAEIIGFNRVLTADEEKQVNSYLGIKYGLTINHDYLDSQGSIIKKISDGFNEGIACIGRDDISGLHQSKSCGEDPLFSIELIDKNAIPNQSFIIWGSRSEALLKNELMDVFDIELTPRIWRVEEIGKIGPVKIHLNQSDYKYLLMSSSPQMTNFQSLKIDEDNSLVIDIQGVMYFTFSNKLVPFYALSCR